MDSSEALVTAQTELATGMALAKCRKCGCMRDTLDNLTAMLPSLTAPEHQPLVSPLPGWTASLQPVQYSCLGCPQCYAAVAQNALAIAFPSASPIADLSCSFQVQATGWPVAVGEYTIVDTAAPVAVSTLGSVGLAETLATRRPHGLAIAGKTETENIGIDKVVKNIITNPAIHFLIVAGHDPEGHQSGRTLLALWEHGIDNTGRVISSPGKRPVLRNVTADEIRVFRGQVDVVDMIGCEDVDEIVRRVQELAAMAPATCGCQECAEQAVPLPTSAASLVTAEPGLPVRMDKQGYFVVTPLAGRGLLHIEHYSYDNVLLRAIEGRSVREVYMTIVAQGWISELSHAAYLGKELARAELSMTLGFKYVQDAA